MRRILLIVLLAIAFHADVPAAVAGIAASAAAVSLQHRRAISLDTAGNQATITDLDTGRAHTVMTGLAPVRAAVVEKTARAYVVGKGLGHAANAGTITDIDLRSGLARTYPVLGFMPEAVAADASGSRVYVVGSIAQRATDSAPFYVQAFDAAARHMVGDPAPIGRLARPTGDGVQVSAALDSASANLYLVDTASERLAIHSLASGEVRTVELEAAGHALAVNMTTRTLMVWFAAEGYAGVFSLGGERLDSVPLSRAPTPADLASQASSVVNLTDVWVDPSKPGSGVFLDQQGATLFATLFTHDAAGNPSWLFMSNGTRQGDGSFAGDLYRTRGPLEESLRNVAAVGSLRFIPGRGDVSTLIYYADGMLHTRNVQRFRFGEGARDCRWAVHPDKAIGERTNFTALWSNPADPGWGVAVSQLGDTAFAVLFTYDETNRATWAVMSRGRRNSQGGFSGDVYRAIAGRIELAGTMSISFSSADGGTLRYRLSGLDFQAPILRNSFSRLTTQCHS